MNKAKRAKEWERMIKSLTDPEERDKAARETAKKKRIAEKIADTGL